jgi:hypothetical protein
MVWMWEYEVDKVDAKGKPVKARVLSEIPVDNSKKVRVAYYYPNKERNLK